MKTSSNIHILTRLLLVAVVFFFCNSIENVSAQSLAYPNYSYTVDKNYIKSYWTGTKNMVTGPARWKGKEWGIAAGVFTAGVVLYIYDDDIRIFFQSYESQRLEDVSKYIFEPWGNGIYPAILLGSMYVYGLAAKKTKARQIALGGTQAIVLTGITTQLIKHLTHRHRPYQDEPPTPRLWEGPFKGWEYTSFPSFHTSTAFSLASFFASVYKDKIWIGILSYGIATGVGLSRIYENEHWASDVLIGAALGYGIGKTIFFLMDDQSKLSMGISETGGISIVYHLE